MASRNCEHLYTFLIISLSYAFCVQSYTHIVTIGNGNGEKVDDGPKIFRAINMDLLYPKTFNSSGNFISSDQTSTTTAWPESINSQQEQQILQNFNATTSPPIFVTPVNQAQNEMVQPQQQQFRYSMQHEPEFFLEQKTKNKIQQNNGLQAESSQFASTGRAVDYQPTTYQNHLGQLITPLIRRMPNAGQSTAYGGSREVQHYTRPPKATPSMKRLQYPHTYRMPARYVVKDQIMDRYTPGEAVASAYFRKQSKNRHNQMNSAPLRTQSSIIRPRPASSNVISSYVPPKDLYSFPPNINAKYPSPSEDPKAALPSATINSYYAPPSGPLTVGKGYQYPSGPLTVGKGYQYPSIISSNSSSDGYKYSGPINPDYLPPKETSSKGTEPSNDDVDTDGEDNDDTIGVLPASAMDGDNGPMSDMDMPPDDEHHMPDHNDAHLSGYEDGKEYPTPPPGWLEEHPDSTHDPPEHRPHHSFDLSLLDHHDHHHDHQDIEKPPLDTTPPAPVEPPPEPRVKKYSYFYIGRKLWYIPLYFTVWFSFYVLWLIIKSIARHKVNLPNHYVSRRSIPQPLETTMKNYINQLTIDILGKIENYKLKHL